MTDKATALRIYDVIVLGAGGAGMMCAATAAARGRKTIVLDHADKLGKKILISGGGRCNFTNFFANASTYYSENEHFSKSALARFTPQDFLALIHKHKIAYHEKKLGQQFCDGSAQAIVNLLYKECEEAGAEIQLFTKIEGVKRVEDESSLLRFTVSTNYGIYACESLVIATGGLSIPKIGATDFGHRLARKFGLKITELVPALVALIMNQAFQKKFGELSGISVDSEVTVNKKKFRENILFTHTGVSGPAILQASLYWNPGDEISVNLCPEKNMSEWLLDKKCAAVKAEVKNLLTEFFTKRFSEVLCEEFLQSDAPVNQISDSKLQDFGRMLNDWRLIPHETGGYGRAEVTRGGVDTNELSSKNMEAKKVPGLYFIGEVVDVTGMLGGYNFQWAWASGHAAGSSA